MLNFFPTYVFLDDLIMRFRSIALCLLLSLSLAACASIGGATPTSVINQLNYDGATSLAIELHHLKGLSVADAADNMGRSKMAVVGLLFRGLKRLRLLLDSPNVS